MANETPAKRMSADDIITELNAIAADSGNRDQFKALKLLSGLSGGVSSVVLPPPLTPNEIVDRLARLMRPAGLEYSRAAFRLAFGRKRQIAVGLNADVDRLSPEDKDKLRRIRDLKSLYRLCPGLKRPGVPTGWPRGEGPEERKLFCQSLALRYLAEAAESRSTPPLEPRQSPTSRHDGSQEQPPA